ncbi:MAG: HPF/RaiA family ribosome-associated protein [Phycisphaerales bacterium]
MKVPIEIAFKGIRNTDELDDLIREEAAKLERVCDYISSCRVIVELRQKHQTVGSPYRVRIDMTVPPGHELVVKQEPSQGDMHDPVEIVIKNVFESASRQLRKLAEQQRGNTKSHPEQEVMAVVARIFPDQEYGFLRTVDTQQDVYFHKNSVLHHGFERLMVGTGVRYTAHDGDEGPQATGVQIVDTGRTPVKPRSHQ